MVIFLKIYMCWHIFVFAGSQIVKASKRIISFPPDHAISRKDGYAYKR